MTTGAVVVGNAADGNGSVGLGHVAEIPGMA